MKRFLSLVLALVMTMSLVTVASAKDFTDADAINYAEAIDVVSAVGIIDGYTDGSFNPQGGLTRGAAAKIICNLILGPTTAENLIADAAPYSDVPTSNVFAGYIAYCQKEGIISGYADGTFKPAASLTGFAFMKMLLGALGYDAKIEGYTGNNWSINVAKQALAIGLEDGLEGTFNGAKALTREEACLYAFNTLKATMVEYDETTNIVIGDIQINTTSNEKAISNIKTKYNAADALDDTMQFCEKYFGELKLDNSSSAARDGFGRPANYWTLEGEDIGKYAQAAADKDVSRGYNQVSALLNSSSYLDYDATDYAAGWNLYINGDPGVATANTPKGAVIETFKNTQGKVTDVVVYWYEYAKIDAIETDLNTDAKKQGASAYIDLVQIDGKTGYELGSYYDAYDNASVSYPVLSGYTDKYVEDTVLAICSKADGQIIDSYIPKAYSGVPTASQQPTYKASGDAFYYEGYITVGGSKYEYAGNMVGVTGAVDFETEYTVYVSNEGYAFAVDGSNALDVDDLYYVTGVYASTEKGAKVVYAQAVSLAYGTEKEFVIETTDALYSATTGAFVETGVKGLYSLTDKTVTSAGVTVCKGNDGKFNATAYTGSSTDKYDVIGGDFSKALTSDVKTDAFKVDYTGSGKSYITDETVFISVDGKADALTSKYGKGSMQMQSGTTVIVLEEKDSNEAALILYVGTNLKGAVDTEDVVYLAGAAKVSVSTGYQATLYYMKDMSSKSVVLDGRYARGFWTYSTNDDGTITLNSLAAIAPMTIDADDDMTTGYVLDVQALEQRSQRLTGANSLTASGVAFDDVSFSGLTVIDTRNSGDRDQDAYKQEIKSAAGLAAAIDKKGGDASMDVYVVDGQIVFAAVYAMGGELLTAADLDLPTSFDGALQLNNAYYATQNPTYMTFALKNVSGAAIDYVSYHNYMVDSNGYVANSQVMYGGFNRTVANNGTYTANGSAPVAILAASNGKYVDGTYDLYSWIETATGEKYGTVTTVTISGGTVTVPFVLPTSVNVTLPVGTYASTAAAKGLGWRSNTANTSTIYITLENNTGAALPLTPYNVVIKDAGGNTVVSRLDIAPSNPANAAGAVTAWSTGASLAALGEGTFTVWAWGVAADGKTYGNLGFTISTVHEHSYASAWSSDATNHWHACSCGDKKDLAAHIPGPAATTTTPQKCTECEHVLAPALGVVIPAGVPASLDVTLPVGTYATTVAAKGLGWRSNTTNTNGIYITLTNNTGAAVNIKPYNVIIVDSVGNEVVNRSATGTGAVNPSNAANAAGAVTAWATNAGLAGSTAATKLTSGTYTVYAWGIGVDDSKTYGNLGFEITIP